MIIHQLNLNSMAWYRMLVLNGNRMDDNHDDNRMIGILKHQAHHAIFSSSGWLFASNINKDRCQQAVIGNYNRAPLEFVTHLLRKREAFQPENKIHTHTGDLAQVKPTLSKNAVEMHGKMSAGSHFEIRRCNHPICCCWKK